MQAFLVKIVQNLHVEDKKSKNDPDTPIQWHMNRRSCVNSQVGPSKIRGFHLNASACNGDENTTGS